MRNGRRRVLRLTFVLAASALVGAAPAASRAASGTERTAITIELTWNASGPAGSGSGPVAPGEDAAAQDLELSATEGMVADVIGWPSDRGDSSSPQRVDAGRWRLGTGTSGKVRARVEVSPGTELVVRRAQQLVRVPMAAVLEKPQDTPTQAPLSVSVRRLPWDSLLVGLGKGAEDGIAPTSADVPVTVRYNIVWPDAGEVMVRTTLALRPARGGDPVWQDEQRHLTPANRLDAAGRTWNVRTPDREGSYVLEVHAAWEPSATREGTRIGRLIRRRKAAPVATSASRRMILAVAAPRAPERPSGEANVPAREAEADSVDLARIRSSRFSATGRVPLPNPRRAAWALPDEVLGEAGRKEHDRLRGWINRTVSEAAKLGPADESGLAWSAVGLKVNHPERPHRVTVTVVGGDPAALGVAMVDPGGAGRRPRVLLDACASGPPILNAGPPATFSWIVWPDCAEPLLVLLNRNGSSPVRLGTARLTELEGLPSSPAVRLPNTPATRTIGVYLPGTGALDRFGGEAGGLPDPFQAARNLVSYLTYCGASMVVLPEGMSDREPRRRLQGQAEEDSLGPDRLSLVLRLLRREGYSALVELKLDGKDAMPGLPPPDSAEALRHGLVRVDRRGLTEDGSYHPLHPEVRLAMKRRVEQALARRPDGTAFGGVVIRLGPGASLLGTPDSGLDDETFLRFVKDTFGPETQEGIPGLGTTDPERFSARSKYLSGVGRMPWLTWRSRAIASLYADLQEAARAASPGAQLVVATPGLHSGAAGAEARRVDLAGLAPSQAWRSVGLDLDVWPSGGQAPMVLRGIELSDDPLAHDLAGSPDLDAKVARCPNRGLLLTAEGDASDAIAAPAFPPIAAEPAGGRDEDEVPAEAGREEPAAARTRTRPANALELTSLPLGDGVLADEPLGHAVAAIDAQWVILSASAISGHEERVRRFAAVFRALPAWAPRSVDAAAPRQDFGVVVRSMSEQGESYLGIANDTPYPIRLAGLLDGPTSAVVEDLGRNLRLIPATAPEGRQLVLDVPPFGVSAIRIGAPAVQLTAVTPYPSDAVMTSMEARYRELSNQLSRLNRGHSGDIGIPPNPGFEPEPAQVLQAQSTPDNAAADAVPGRVPGGWSLAGPQGSTIAIDRRHPHGGQGSLKLAAPAAPAALVSGNFVPASASSMLIQAYFRAEPADVKVRVWIEGEASGQTFVRRSELLAPADWEARAVRASDLPAGGLDAARLRFELLTPGTLWIDDLRILGEATPETVRVNAQRTLLAALQAYRARRYAEFARLASSHWARHPSLLAGGRSGTPGQLSSSQGNGRPGAAAASALSSDRTVR